MGCYCYRGANEGMEGALWEGLGADETSVNTLGAAEGVGAVDGVQLKVRMDRDKVRKCMEGRINTGYRSSSQSNGKEYERGRTDCRYLKARYEGPAKQIQQTYQY
jgi:hypothetical protein